MNIVAACFYDTGRIEQFLDEKAREELERNRYFHAFQMTEDIWHILLISDDQRYRSVYLAQYYEPGEDPSQYGCYALSDIKTIVTPPSIQNGQPVQGSIRLEKAN